MDTSPHEEEREEREREGEEVLFWRRGLIDCVGLDNMAGRD